MKWKGRGRKQPWPNLINYIVLYLAEWRKTTKTLRVGDLWDSTWMGTSRIWNRRATFSNVTFAHSYCFQFCVMISTISRDADTHPPSSLNVKMVGLCLWVTQNVQSSVMHGGNLFITLWRLKERKGVKVTLPRLRPHSMTNTILFANWCLRDTSCASNMVDNNLNNFCSSSF
jgi:hypothetical protein